MSTGEINIWYQTLEKGVILFQLSVERPISFKHPTRRNATGMAENGLMRVKSRLITKPLFPFSYLH